MPQTNSTKDSVSNESKEKKPKHEPPISNFNLLKEVLEFNVDKNEVQAADTDWLIMRGGFLRDLLESLKVTAGAEGNIALQKVGKAVGSQFALSMFRKELTTDEVPTILSLLLNQGGWGKTEIKADFEKKTAVVTIQNCITARNIEAKEPNCFFFRGYFEGLFEKLFNSEMDCVESSCLATGCPGCIFNVKQRKNVNHLPKDCKT